MPAEVRIRLLEQQPSPPFARELVRETLPPQMKRWAQIFLRGCLLAGGSACTLLPAPPTDAELLATAGRGGSAAGSAGSGASAGGGGAGNGGAGARGGSGGEAGSAGASGAASGTGGGAATGGAAGTSQAGASGTAGTAGLGGAAGSSGSAGTAGNSGAAGISGNGGAAGTAGSSGASGGGGAAGSTGGAGGQSGATGGGGAGQGGGGAAAAGGGAGEAGAGGSGGATCLDGYGDNGTYGNAFGLGLVAGVEPLSVSASVAAGQNDWFFFDGQGAGGAGAAARPRVNWLPSQNIEVCISIGTAAWSNSPSCVQGTAFTTPGRCCSQDGLVAPGGAVGANTRYIVQVRPLSSDPCSPYNMSLFADE